MTGTETNARELVFVYGTLRKGATNHERMAGAQAVSDAWILGRLYAIDWFPGMLLDDEEGIPVRGEVYGVDREGLRALDEFEGASFERVKALVNLKSGESQEVWVYEFRGELKGKKELIPADWLQARTKRPPSVFCLLTFALMPLTLGFGFFSWWSPVSGPRGIEILMELLGVLAPLAPFVTARVGMKRRESLAEGAGLCAAIALLLFGTGLIVRYLPVAFGVFPN